MTDSYLTSAPTGTVQAVAGVTYQSQTDQTITFAPGQTEVNITIPLTNTPITEAQVFGVEIFNVSVGSIMTSCTRRRRTF